VLASAAKISQLSMSACSALGDIFRSGPLPLPPGGGPVDQSGGKGDTGEKQPSIEDIVTGRNDELNQRDLVSCLSKILQSAKEIKVCTVIGVDR
jgi:hypothetical protein